MDINAIADNMTTEELAGQVLCPDIYGSDDPEKTEEKLRKLHAGGIFVKGMTKAQIKAYTDMANKYSSVPVIVSGDVECGPGWPIKGEKIIPHAMAWGACDNGELIQRAGRQVGEICRDNGIHWTYSPVVDLNLNFRSPECNIRSISDKPQQVVKIAKAFVSGIEYNDNMVACCKHFPGEGVDERNSHFCTGINSLSKEEWMKTYGFVYREMINAGIKSIMVGHTALPAFESECDDIKGYPPAVFSKSLMTDLLRNELHFEGCIVSDAMTMIGASAYVNSLAEIPVRFLQAGGDMILFPQEEDYDTILKAVKNGELSETVLKNAVRRILKMKESVRLLSGTWQKNTADGGTLASTAQEIADNAVTVIRNYNKVIPFNCKKGAKVLMLNMSEPYFQAAPTGREFDALKEELEKNGLTVKVLSNPDSTEARREMQDADLVLLNVKMSSEDYHGGSLRVGWNNIMVLWNGYILQHPNFVCISFGDPYKLFDMPYLKEYVNCYSSDEYVQRAAAKVILGKIPAKGKSPVEFKGYFPRGI